MKTGLKRVKLHVKKNDMVVVLSGNDRGKSGKVLRVYPVKNRVIIEGVNIRKRHMRPTQSNPQGSIIEREFPIHASNVKKS
ncbi:50S ribosomal protein L24 [Pelodictyon luteolum]|uniref:Large ribosomal subunit protein uL24 n=1 Tax=Chlorobium luteolum (strain DSM 273 / BCRC 81028 / 2530) TaxID=319225 RepID=RL24_CHLL3|nr:50S ribosomal protein L24 [Pelodictyon luteolum]Q3B6F1.1 RecName: Full=Large ribosomal subunit protein uL24; AltName: Full=50S ribosomal protein L24 [Pelodictyon luteolum DSM 273]ABB23080.1 LSU ribosomal protein L24P [Pelodictyon luteolum DSM 273]